MNYFIYEIFLLLFLVAEFPIAKANELYDYEHFFLKFVKDTHNFEQFCKENGVGNELYKFLNEYRAILGVMFFLRRNWHCANIGKEFEKHERQEFEKYRKYLDIVYEYLFRVHSGFPAVKPMFYFGQIYALCPMTETVKSLVILSRFYFNSEFGKSNGHKLKILFVEYYELKLFNENELNYKGNLGKETFQENVVRMGLELKWENEIGKSYLNLFEIGGSHFKLFRQKFDGFLEGMLEKAEESKGLSSKMATSANYVVNFNEYCFWKLHSLFSQSDPTLDDVAIVLFLKGQSNFEQFCKQLEKDNYKKSMPLSKPLETYLPILYLMRLKWHCAKNADESEKEKELRLKCEKYRNYLRILYEYLFIVYATEQRMMAKQMPAVWPMFKNDYSENSSIFKTAQILHSMSEIIFCKATAEEKLRILNPAINFSLNLLNENSFRNYVANYGNWSKTLREEFENKLKRMLKNAREIFKLKENYAFKYSPFYDTVEKASSKD